jgi:hypothetical protein
MTLINYSSRESGGCRLSASTVLFHVPDLAYQTVESVEKLLGPPTEILPSPPVAAAVPDELRTYLAAGNSELSIQFCSGRAVCFTLWFDLRGSNNPATAEAAVAAVGVDVTELSLGRSGPSGRWWKGRSGELSFSRIGATRSEDGTGWTCVLIRLDTEVDSLLALIG